jgi:hypothetical protein
MLDLAYTAFLDFLARSPNPAVRTGPLPSRFVPYRSDQASFGKPKTDRQNAPPTASPTPVTRSKQP